MKEILRTYNTQFTYTPVIVNEHLIAKNFKQIVLCGMGGSHLSVGLMKVIEPGIDIYVHRDYDLPPFSKMFLENSLLVASSYSGNTEETLSFYKKVKQLYDFPILCISQGGELLELAKKNNDPYIELPMTQFVPRTALGIVVRAISLVLKDKTMFNTLGNITLDIEKIEGHAQNMLSFFESKSPVFYSSNQNLNLAYNWKIKFNETAKKIAFYNVFPESNHNELESYEFDTKASTFLPVLLTDSTDHPRIQKRFEVFKEILKQKSITYLEIDISNSDVYQKVFEAIVLGDFVSAYLAEKSGFPQANVPLIEEFKKRLV
jgi:glucose/mannose-6-phosphate isomerase